MEAEDDIIRRWQQGDPTAFALIVRRWQTPIARFIARMLGSSANVADLTQDVFLKAHQAIGRYRHEGAFSTWLYRIALNNVRDAARRRRTQPQPLPAEIVASSPHTLSDWEQQELNTIMELVLGELPETLRSVLVLRHDEGMSFEAMARLLETPASTLKSRFAVALKHLRDRLNELGYGEGENA